MKIILIGTAYPLRGGIAHYNALLVKYLEKKHNVEVITFKRQYPKILFPGKSQEEPSSSDIPIKTEQLIDSINPINWIKVGLKLRKRKADVVIFKYWLPFFGPCFGTICRIIKWKRPTKIIAICDNVIPHEHRPGDKIFTLYTFNSVDSFIVQSDTVERDLKTLISTPIYKKVPHPIYENFGVPIRKNDAKAKLDIKDDKVILFFGYIRHYKGLHTLIDAMKIVKESINVKLLVVGEFYDNEKNYRTHIKNENLEDTIQVISDYIPNEKVAEYFSASDVVVLPYISATQSGIVQIAYNFDKPVIVTNVGGLTEVVIDGITGLVVPPESPNELAKAIIKFYAENLEAKLIQGVIEEKKKYSWDNLVKAIEDLFDELKND